MNPGPEVCLDAGAVAWVADRGGVITLRPSPRHGCCGGTALVPVAEARRPDAPEGWIARDVDGVRVYIDPAMIGQAGPLVVRAEGFLGWRRLFVEAAGPGVRDCHEELP